MTKGSLVTDQRQCDARQTHPTPAKEHARDQNRRHSGLSGQGSARRDLLNTRVECLVKRDFFLWHVLITVRCHPALPEPSGADDRTNAEERPAYLVVMPLPLSAARIGGDILIVAS